MRVRPDDIDRFFRKWLQRRPLPLRREDSVAGYDWNKVLRYDGQGGSEIAFLGQLTCEYPASSRYALSRKTP